MLTKGKAMLLLKHDLKLRARKEDARQKGLGVGRVGDKRAIQRRGGGVSFGPRPRSYNQKVNKKIKRLAMERARDQATAENICLIEDWEIAEPKLFKSLLFPSPLIPKTFW